METIEVLQPGAMTTIQDLGRFGYQQYGVPSSGAMDSYAFRVGNLLIGNNEGAPSLEITLFGCRLRFRQDTAIAVTGADSSPALNGAPAPLWQTVFVKSGDILAFPRLKSG
jgi:antagonist of KipI